MSDIGFVRSSSNLADGIKKQMDQAMLRALINSGVLVIQSEQGIGRR